MTEKKKMSKGKKAVIIVVSVIAFFIVVVLVGGLAYLHEYCKPKTYEPIKVSTVTDSQNITLIAHRGFTAVAPENTVPAFEKAGESGFSGAECDIYRTKDGVWVIHHDSHTYRMMDQSSFIEKLTYDELMEYTYDNGSNIADYPDLKVCTLEEYLEICKAYNMTAVIELKGKNNTEHYDEVVDTVNKVGAKDVIYISFHLDNLKKLRALSDAPLYYLVQKIDDQAIADALSLGGACGIDFNGNKEENTPEIIQKCFDEGLLMGAWTIDKGDALNRMLDSGVTLITTNTIHY